MDFVPPARWATISLNVALSQIRENGSLAVSTRTRPRLQQTISRNLLLLGAMGKRACLVKSKWQGGFSGRRYGSAHENLQPKLGSRLQALAPVSALNRDPGTLLGTTVALAKRISRRCLQCCSPAYNKETCCFKKSQSCCRQIENRQRMLALVLAEELLLFLGCTTNMRPAHGRSHACQTGLMAVTVPAAPFNRLFHERAYQRSKTYPLQCYITFCQSVGALMRKWLVVRYIPALSVLSFPVPATPSH